MLAVVAPRSPHQRMSPSSSHAFLNGPQSPSTPGPSRFASSQHRLSQMTPAHGSSSHREDAPQHRDGAADTSRTSSSPSPHHAPATLPPMHATPLKTSLRLSHPPPAPSSSFLQHATPQSKRTRFSYTETDSATTTASPLSRTPNSLHNASIGSTDTSSLSASSLSNVRPLSGISLPRPLPATPSRPQRPSPSTSNAPHLIPMPQRSIEDFQRLLPPPQPSTARYSRTDTPQRALLQNIPPQPPMPIQTGNMNAGNYTHPTVPTVETLPSRRSWSLTGFRSFDLDLDRIAQVVQLEQDRLHSADDSAPSDPTRTQPQLEFVDTFGASFCGCQDRGLPSGSILEMLGPPGSGKSSFLLQFAITERLRALRRARESLWIPHGHDEALAPNDAQINHPFTDSSYFSEEFWDAEVATADQVLIIDCEGALTPEKVADAAWTAVIELWASLPGPSDGSDRVESGKSTLQCQRSAMPEDVRRLVAAILTGLHVSRVTSLAGLVALLHSLRPTDELQEGLSKKALPSALPLRTSLILIDSLSYYLRPSGGSGQDRKTAAQVSERVHDLVLRLQKPFEYMPHHEATAEEREAARKHCSDAAEKLCVPTIVFTNQLGIRRGRKESEASGRSSPAGRPSMGTGSSRFSSRNNAGSEGPSTLAPLLNGTRPPQPARLRDERPAFSVALGGPEMWDDEGGTAVMPRHRQQYGGRNAPSQPVSHDRGWPPSFLGQDVWRMLLFRHGTFGHRYAQITSVPPAVQTELSELWTQTKERVNARAQAGAIATSVAAHRASDGQALQEQPEAQESTAQTGASLADSPPEDVADKQDQRILELLRQLQASLFRWRPFQVDSRGLVS
ncbi:hypothetical protein PHSY_006302 [Pseudozyma hubeiensis SY62]|uniref:RecA family profile 1 domain-containing protein n=1 Tax=Pseudozyma hubeiensis (strain SY62) TaxID=1305764 RepID=R9PBC2_PSEHS|nr:hypothetical protein PHSY_006302 [Pseudozyma hubeiensis SY62]GAC98708.1 hypothetical protein PHSY_006302 [Pseudozyma hubeiensis SY62]